MSQNLQKMDKFVKKIIIKKAVFPAGQSFFESKYSNFAKFVKKPLQKGLYPHWGSRFFELYPRRDSRFFESKSSKNHYKMGCIRPGTVIF